VRRIARDLEGEVTLDVRDAPELPAVETPLQFRVQGVEARPHRLHQEPPRGAGRGDHPVRLACVHGERLLHQDVLAGLQHHHRVLAVHRVDPCHVHDINLEVGGECRHRPVRARDAPRGGELTGPRGGAAADGDSLGIPDVGEVAHEIRRDPPRACDAPANRHQESQHSCARPPQQRVPCRQYLTDAGAGPSVRRDDAKSEVEGRHADNA
jgi:hypothetical protein